MEITTRMPSQGDTFSIVERVARIVSSVRGARTDYAHLASELAPVIPFDLFGVALLRHDRAAARVVSCTREGDIWVSRYHQLPLVDSMLKRVLHAHEHGEPLTLPQSAAPISDKGQISVETLLFDDSLGMLSQTCPAGLDGTPAQCGDAISGNPHLRAVLIVPLVVGERVLGTLELGSVEKDAYRDDTVRRTVHAIARVLATAIENVQAGGNVEIQDRQRQALQKVSTALASKSDLTTILSGIVEGIAKALNVASAVITLDLQKDGLRLYAQHGVDAGQLEAIIEQQALHERSIVGFALRRRQPTTSSDIMLDERFPRSKAFASQLHMHSICCYPLVAGTRIFGVLLLLSPEAGGFTPLKMEILALFASQATVAIHNHLLLESTRERQRFQEVIDQLEANTQQMTSEEEQTLLQDIREKAERTFGVHFSSLLRLISESLLTRSEREVQAMLHSREGKLRQGRLSVSIGEPPESEQETKQELLQEQSVVGDGESVNTDEPSIALQRVELLGNVGAALAALDSAAPVLDSAAGMPSLYEHLTSDMQDPWFVVDLQGYCIYMNRAAETFCDTRFGLSMTLEMQLLEPIVDSDSLPIQRATLPELLGSILRRMRNRADVLAYLEEFTSPTIADEHYDEWLQQIRERHEYSGQIRPFPTNTLRCVIASEPLQPTGSAFSLEQGQVSGVTDPRYRRTPYVSKSIAQVGKYRSTKSHAHMLDNAPSDRHYQFTHYALYKQETQELIAHALRVHDITEQVRDERNKSALLASVSHDLRTPLTSIKAAVSGLLQPGVKWDEKLLQDMLQDIDSEADHLARLINAMVEMSRIEMGALILEKEWCDLLEILYSSVEKIEPYLAGRTIRCEPQGQLPLVQVDFLQMERVFDNLLENAVRHSPKDAEILVTIEPVALGDSSEEDGSTITLGALRIQVIDHGSGVPDEERERIFKSFYSPDRHTGLGLAICRGIIEAHHGNIWVEAASGGGACFVFVLPISS